MKTVGSSLVAIAAISVALVACGGTAADAPTATLAQANGAKTLLGPSTVTAARTLPALPTSPATPEPLRSPPQTYYLTSTSAGFTPAPIPGFSGTATPATLALVANGLPGNFAVNSRTGGSTFSFSIAGANSGTPNCPTGDVALDQTNGTAQNPVTIAGYAAGQCVLSIAVGATALQLVVNVSPTTGPSAPAGNIAGVFPAASGGLVVQSWAAANPTQQSTLFSVASACAAATGFARDTAGETYIAIGTFNPGSCHLIEKFAADAKGFPAPIASVTLPAGAGIGGLAIDGSGNVYVALPGASTVAEYSSDLSTQLAELSGSNTGLDEPVSVAFDASGNLYVINFPVAQNVAPPGSIAEFAPLTAGSNNVAPTRTILTGGDKNCSLANDPAMVIDASGDVLSENASGGITEFTTGGAASSFGASGSANGLTIDGTRLYESLSPYYGCSQSPTEPTSLEYFDLSNPTTPVPFVTTTSGTSPQLVNY